MKAILATMFFLCCSIANAATIPFSGDDVAGRVVIAGELGTAIPFWGDSGDATISLYKDAIESIWVSSSSFEFSSAGGNLWVIENGGFYDDRLICPEFQLVGRFWACQSGGSEPNSLIVSSHTHGEYFSLMLRGKTIDFLETVGPGPILDEGSEPEVLGELGVIPLGQHEVGHGLYFRSDMHTFDRNRIRIVPEPQSYAMLLMGIILFARVASRTARKVHA